MTDDVRDALEAWERDAGRWCDLGTYEVAPPGTEAAGNRLASLLRALASRAPSEDAVDAAMRRLESFDLVPGKSARAVVKMALNDAWRVDFGGSGEGTGV